MSGGSVVMLLYWQREDAATVFFIEVTSVSRTPELRLYVVFLYCCQLTVQRCSDAIRLTSFHISHAK